MNLRTIHKEKEKDITERFLGYQNHRKYKKSLSPNLRYPKIYDMLCLFAFEMVFGDY